MQSRTNKGVGLSSLLNVDPYSGEKIDFVSLNDVHLAAVLLKTFLRDLTEPVIPFALYNDVLRITGKLLCLSISVFMEWFVLIVALCNVKINRMNLLDYAADERNVAVRDLVNRLPRENYDLLKTVAHFLTEVSNCLFLFVG